MEETIAHVDSVQTQRSVRVHTPRISYPWGWGITRDKAECQLRPTRTLCLLCFFLCAPISSLRRSHSHLNRRSCACLCPKLKQFIIALTWALLPTVGSHFKAFYHRPTLESRHDSVGLEGGVSHLAQLSHGGEMVTQGPHTRSYGPRMDQGPECTCQ